MVVVSKMSCESMWWVTYASNDQDAEGVLRLIESIRKTGSIRQICVLLPLAPSSAALPTNISSEMRATVEMMADDVIQVSVNDNDDGGVLAIDVELTLSAWKVCGCKKVVVLHPHSLVLENCDDLFQIQNDKICAFPNQHGQHFRTTTLLLAPSSKVFREICDMATDLRLADESVATLSLERILNAYFGADWMVLSNGFQYKIVNTFPSAFDCDIQSESSKMAFRLSNSNSVAVVGFSCRFADADNANEFWDLLFEGRDVTRPLPPSRYYMRGASVVSALEGEGGGLQGGGEDVPAGYLKCGIDEFDAKFFQISRREAEYMDPQQRLLLELTWEAFENAGIDPTTLRGSSASTFFGIWAQEYAMSVRLKAQSQDSHFQYLGNALCAASARVSHFFGFRGPSITFESGCASALQAVHHGCDNLRNGTTDLVIAGGVNVALNCGLTLAGFDSFILSKDGKCKTFDKDANGFARGEACVVMILKRERDAVRDGNTILGLIASSSVNSDGAGSSLGTPNAEAQEQVIREALAKSGIEPHEVSYVEAHGTGTPVGDPLEFSAINGVFGGDARRTQPLLVGSVKTNIGHTEGASGVAGLVKVLLAIRHRTIPRHLNLVNLNPYIDLDKIPAIIPMDNTEWKPCSERGLVAGVSSFGLSGTNVHLVVQEPKKTLQRVPRVKLEKPNQDRSAHILVLSAATEDALSDLAVRYAQLLESNTPNTQLTDVAFSANTGRAHLTHRLAVVAENSAQAVSRLQKGQYISSAINHHSTSIGSKNRSTIGFLFTGQGSQYKGMAKELYVSNQTFKRCFDDCNALLRHYDLDLDDIISDLALVNRHSQPTIFCIEYCLAKLWQSFGIHPDFVLGHSVGEFAAAVIAGFISLEQGLRLVVERSRLVEKVARGSMLVLKVSRTKTQQLINEFVLDNSSIGPQSQVWIDIAAHNSSDETVVSGPCDVIASFEKMCHSRQGVQTQRLGANHAFHSRAMDSILEEYQEIANGVEYKSPAAHGNPRFVSGTLGRVVGIDELISNSKYWVSHLRDAVNFTDAFKVLAGCDCRMFVEVGPQPVLLSLGMAALSIEKASGCTWCPSIRRSESNWLTLLTSLGRIHTSGVANVDWTGFDEGYGRRRVELPNYPFQREKYWLTAGGEAGNLHSMRINSKLLHPLLGRRVPSPCGQLVSYYNPLRPSSSSHLSYVNEHKVSDVVILPAVGYLEMVLAAGCDMIGGCFSASIPLSVRSLVVESALALTEEECAQIQTTVTTKEGGDDGGHEVEYVVTIYKQTVFDGSGSDAGTWKKLASAIFVPCASIDSATTKSIDLDSLRSDMTLRPSVDDVYSKLVEMGIQFGPQFKSVHRLWYTDSRDRILTETVLPECSDRYVCHPIVLDAMIQTSVTKMAMSHEKETESKGQELTGLFLPYAIHKFVSLPKAWTPKLYMLLEEARCSLYNEQGEFMATMDTVDFVSTTCDSFLRSIRSDVDIYPTFYDESWLHKGGTGKTGTAAGTASGRPVDRFVAGIDRAAFEQLQVDVEEAAREYMVKYGHLQRDGMELAYLYIINSLRELGWNNSTAVVGGDLVSVSEFGREAGVVPQHAKLFRRWIQILEEEGVVQFVDDDRVRVLKAMSDGEELQILIQTCISKFHGEVRRIDCQYVINFGENLTALMQGKMSPFTLLFPESKDAVGAEAVYSASVSSSKGYECMAPMLLRVYDRLPPSVKSPSELPSNYSNPNPVLQILEIGAGTGSSTDMLLRQLSGLNIEFEYTFTDISPLFVKLAKEKFADQKNMRFKLLDIECDPKRQGFVPHSYDCIIADFVFHATRDLSETLNNTRHLLVPHGVLVISEIVFRMRALDNSFGFLEGWWRFTDHHLRKDYACINSEEWMQLLPRHGFPIVERYEELDKFKVFGFFIAIADDHVSTKLSPTSAQPQLSAAKEVTPIPVWFIFGGDDLLTQNLKKRLQDVGESVLIIYPATPAELGADNLDNLEWGERGECSVAVSVVNQYNQLLQRLRERGFQLAGVVHCWSAMATLCHNSQRTNANANDLHSLMPELLGGLMYLVQAMISEDTMCGIHVVTAGALSINPSSDTIRHNPVGVVLLGLLAGLRNEVPGHRFVSLDIEPECFVSNELAGQVGRQVFNELWLDEPEVEVAFRGGAKYVRRIVHHDPHLKSLVMPNTDRWRLLNSPTGNLYDMSVIPTAKLELGSLSKHVEVSVRCVALNFKDILVAYNTGGAGEGAVKIKLLEDAKFLEFVKELGIDFSGEVTRVADDTDKFRVGDKVYGMIGGGLGGALASHVVVPEKNIRPMLPGSSFEDACTKTAVLFTVHYFLIQCAGIRKGDRVLIHAASGGVGLIAIQVAHYFGAQVFATAGSERKRNYLRTFMNVQHVYNSRDTQFGQDILRDTKGGGVDIVLNALTGVGFKEASLLACAPGARFLEMSKLNIWTAEEVKKLRPDVQYFLQDTSNMEVEGTVGASILFGDPDEIFQFGKEIEEAGGLLPLPYSLFTMTRAHDAFRYLQGAKHIGKVIIKMPRPRAEGGRVVYKEDLFHEFGSYLITGGLGGIGLEVAKWMAGSGARFLVLVGRNPPSSRAAAVIESIRGVGGGGGVRGGEEGRVNVIVLQADVSDLTQCENMLEEIKASGFPPLRGIMHAAGVLANEEFRKQTLESFMATIKPKVIGAWNLHELTTLSEKHNCQLEHFILFGSLIGTFGGVGQTNHAAANRYLDSFAAYRWGLGLPCANIQWGMWSDVGVAANIGSSVERMVGLKCFTPAQGIASLQRILLENRHLTMVTDVADWKIAMQTFRQGNMLELVKKEAKRVGNSTAWYERKIQEVKAASPEDRLGLLKEFIEYAVRETLRLSESDVVDHDADLRAMGVDSLMAMELRTKFHDLLKDADEKALSLQNFIEANTINKVSNFIARIMDGGSGYVSLTPEQLLQLVKKDAQLPDDICIARGQDSPCPPSQYRQVLLIGATGQVGGFILHQLTTQHPDLVISCLIRAKSDEAARERLEESLNDFNLLEVTQLEHVLCVAGTITQPNFGLCLEAYSELTRRVDGVINCAAMANHLLHYGEFGPDDVRSTNVMGLVNILRFSVEGKVKRVQHQSGIGVSPSMASMEQRIEDNQRSDDLLEAFVDDDYWGQDFYQSGYLLSKFVGEKLLKEAIQNRGLPITIIRHNYLTGDTKSGILTSRTNHALMVIMASARVKAFPESDEAHITMVPIDVSTSVAVSLFMNDKTEEGIYAINNPNTARVADLLQLLTDRGYECRVVPFDEWRELVLNSHKTEVAPLQDMYTKDVLSSDLFTKNTLARRMRSERPLLPNSIKLKRIVPNVDSVMPHPMKLLEFYTDTYEKTFGKENMAGFLGARKTKAT